MLCLTLLLICQCFASQIYTHAETLDNKDMVIESAVLAGPVTVIVLTKVTGPANTADSITISLLSSVSACV